uniref:Uncharacterized protein n=1 Tax=Sipha flava TaxID=143950 RepID=A0A2S2R925_9HEMI
MMTRRHTLINRTRSDIDDITSKGTKQPISNRSRTEIFPTRGTRSINAFQRPRSHVGFCDVRGRTNTYVSMLSYVAAVKTDFSHGPCSVQVRNVCWKNCTRRPASSVDICLRVPQCHWSATTQRFDISEV